MRVEGKILSYYDDLTDAIKIRKEVFEIEQGVDPKLEFDDLDKQAMHVILYTGGKAVATGRLLKEEDNYTIGRIAVLKEERKKGYGDFVVRMLIDRAFQSGAVEVLLGAQLGAVGFYEKIGFASYGEKYLDANIPHIHMKIDKNGVCKECNNLKNISI